MRPCLLVPLIAALAPLAACSGGARSTHSTTPSRVGPSMPTTATPVDTSAGTTQLVRRPVTAGGQLAPGYSSKDGQGSIDCSAGLRSPVAVSNDVLLCTPSAAYAIACWKASAAGIAYCLTKPGSSVLTTYTLTGRFGTAGPAELEPQPIALALGDGTACTVRDSGAGARLATHPDWAEYYYCGADETEAAWAPADSPTAGIAKGDGPWQVQLAGSDGSGGLHAEAIASATFVGTAA